MFGKMYYMNYENRHGFQWSICNAPIYRKIICLNDDLRELGRTHYWYNIIALAHIIGSFLSSYYLRVILEVASGILHHLTSLQGLTCNMSVLNATVQFYLSLIISKI